MSTVDINQANQKLTELLQALNKETNASKVIIWRTTKKQYRGKDLFPRSSMYRGVSKNGSKWQGSFYAIKDIPVLILKRTFRCKSSQTTGRNSSDRFRRNILPLEFTTSAWSWPMVSKRRPTSITRKNSSSASWRLKETSMNLTLLN